MNAQHLEYIATRPGTIYNPGCGFGLWGNIENGKIGCIADLQTAEQLVMSESLRGRTIYRAVVSIGEPDAGERGFYHREKWEQLINGNISSIAKQMHIAESDFRWVASMHCKEGHPHSHIMYWDAGLEPRPECMPRELFKAAAEKIRAAFSYGVYGQDIRTALDDEKDLLKSMRTELRAMLLDANPEVALPDSCWQQREDITEILDSMTELVKNAPARGSLKYRFLDSDYKTQLDSLTDRIQQLPEFQTLVKRYLAMTEKVGKLYGNDENTIAAGIQKAIVKIRQEMGNEVLQHIREILSELQLQAPETDEALQSMAEKALREVLAENEDFQTFLHGLPRHRIPNVWERSDYQKIREDIQNRIFSDARIRAQLRGYAGSAAAASEEPIKEAFSRFRKAVDREFLHTVYAETGWQKECIHSHTMLSLIRLFSCMSQHGSQQQAQAARLAKHHDLSKEAKADRRQQNSQSGGNQYFEL